jgi:hypothetical protein
MSPKGPPVEGWAPHLWVLEGGGTFRRRGLMEVTSLGCVLEGDIDSTGCHGVSGLLHHLLPPGCSALPWPPKEQDQVTMD